MVQWIPQLKWDEANIAHIARHGVTPEEAEEVRSNGPCFRRGRQGRYYLSGQTLAGRWLFVVIEKDGRVVTARNATDGERRLAERQ